MAINNLIAGKLKKAGIDLSKPIVTTENEMSGMLYFTQEA